MPDHCERWKWRDPGEIIDRLLDESARAERRRLRRLVEFDRQQSCVVSRETSAPRPTVTVRHRLPLLKLPKKGATTCRS